MPASSRKRKVLEPWSPTPPNSGDAVKRVKKRTQKAEDARIVESCPKSIKKSGKVTMAAIRVGPGEDKVEMEPSKVKKKSKKEKPKNSNSKDSAPETENHQFQIALSELVETGRKLPSKIQNVAESGPIASMEIVNQESWCKIKEDSVGMLKPLADSMELIPNLKSFKIVNNSWSATYLGMDGMKDITCSLSHTPLLTTIVVKGRST